MFFYFLYFEESGLFVLHSYFYLKDQISFHLECTYLFIVYLNHLPLGMYIYMYLDQLLLHSQISRCGLVLRSFLFGLYKRYAVAPHLNCLSEAVLVRSQSIILKQFLRIILKMNPV